MYNNEALLKIDSMEGHQFEYWAADMLRKQDFINVTVTPGSGDHGVDILAEKDGIRYAVQCKCYSSNLGNTPVQEVHAGKEMYHCHVGVVLTNRYFTDGAKQLAEATGTLLWDRNYISSFLSQHLEYDSDTFHEDLIQNAIQIIMETNQASVSMLQRRLHLQYEDAAALMKKLEDQKIVGPSQNGKIRKILIKDSVKSDIKKQKTVKTICWIISILVLGYFAYKILHLVSLA